MNRRYLIADCAALHEAASPSHRKIVTWDSVYDYLASGYHRTHSVSCTGKIMALLMFHEEPITDDAYNLAYVQGKAERNTLDDAGKAIKALSSYMSLNDTENEPLIHRFINMAVSNVESEIYNISRFTLRDNVSLDNYLPHKKEFIIEMSLNTDFTDNAVESMRNFIHDYIVSNVLYEWSQITYPKFSEHWSMKKEEDLKQIRIASERDRYRKMEHVTPHW